jgi:type IV pilus assembly protein PilW
MEGSESGATWAPANSTEVTGFIAAGTDAITVRYLDPMGVNLTADMGTNTSMNIPVASVDGIETGDLMAVSDCASSDVFAVTGVSGNAVAHADESSEGLANTSGDLNRGYDEEAEIMRFIARRYFICDGDVPPSDPTQWTCDQDSDGDPDDDSSVYNPTLFVVENDQAPRPLVDGVENMQILYGEDTTADQVADVYVNASAVGSWDNVVSVRVALLLRTTNDNPNNDVDTRSYNLLGTVFNPPDDRRRRRIFSTTIQVRNI